MNLLELKELIGQGDFDQVRAAVEANPDLVHTRDPDPDHWDELTALHSAAKSARLDVVKLIVERGAEVYSNPMNSYPAVFVANSRIYLHLPLTQSNESGNLRRGLNHRKI